MYTQKYIHNYQFFFKMIKFICAQLDFVATDMYAIFQIPSGIGSYL